jgi:anti-sigma regulatory factor (Ser/Thr protein kinase)
MKEIALHLLDIAQNSVRACATEIRITLAVSTATDTMTLKVQDNGTGMDEETCKRAADPWYTSRTTRRVGLGLPLLQMNATLSGGTFEITSAPGKGTVVTATFGYSHIDRPPLGDLSGTIALLIFSNSSINIVFTHILDERKWSISTSEIIGELGREAVSDLTIVRGLREIIGENISESKIHET